MHKPLNRRQLLAAAGALGVTAAWPAHAQDKAGAPILIGQSAHLSGPLAATMTGVVAGQKLAIDEFNAKGGVAGRKVQLITLDDAYDPKKCVDNVSKLIDQDKVTALFGLASTANVGAVLPVLAEKQVPLVGVYTGAPTLRARQHPFFFTTTASYRDEVVQMVKNLKTTLRENIALVYMNNPFGQLMAPIVGEVVKEQGATLVAKAPLEANGSNAVAAAQALGAAHPQAVIFMAFGPSLVPFMKAARAYIGAPVYAVSVSNSKAVLDALGDDARGLAITPVVPNPWKTTTGLGRDFNKVMDKAKLPVDYDHFYGYMNMRVLLEALKRAGKAVTPQSLVTTLEQMSKVDLGGYTVSYGPTNHHGSSFVDIMIVGPGGRFIR
jgi:branched-chain amino acid transport system substrate-binding protein